MTLQPMPGLWNSSGGPADEESLPVKRLPTCEFCLDRADHYEDTIRCSRKSYLCGRHRGQYGRGMANGKGWRLVVMPETACHA